MVHGSVPIFVKLFSSIKLQCDRMVTHCDRRWQMENWSGGNKTCINFQHWTTLTCEWPPPSPPPPTTTGIHRKYLYLRLSLFPQTRNWNVEFIEMWAVQVWEPRNLARNDPLKFEIWIDQLNHLALSRGQNFFRLFLVVWGQATLDTIRGSHPVSPSIKCLQSWECLTKHQTYQWMEFSWLNFLRKVSSMWFQIGSQRNLHDMRWWRRVSKAWGVITDLRWQSESFLNFLQNLQSALKEQTILTNWDLIEHDVTKHSKNVLVCSASEIAYGPINIFFTVQLLDSPLFALYSLKVILDCKSCYLFYGLWLSQENTDKNIGKNLRSSIQHLLLVSKHFKLQNLSIWLIFTDPFSNFYWRRYFAAIWIWNDLQAFALFKAFVVKFIFVRLIMFMMKILLVVVCVQLAAN